MKNKESISEMDLSIFMYLKKGLSNREIGKELSISHHTVKARLAKCYRLLNVRNRTELTDFIDVKGVPSKLISDKTKLSLKTLSGMYKIKVF